MPERFLKTMLTPRVLEAQEQYYGRRAAVLPTLERDALGPRETEFIASRDSFYMATLSESGWPYIQHRGGPAGFLKVLDPHTLGFADFKGNRQLISTGNLAANDRAALFLMDYPQRERLKILGHARVQDAREHRELADQLSPSPELRGKIERVFFIEVVSFDWNCPKYITSRYTDVEVAQRLAPLKERIAELERQLNTRQ